MQKSTQNIRQLMTAPRRWLSCMIRLFSPNDFANTRFRTGMTAAYRGQEYQITAVNFMDQLLELRHADDAPEDAFWVREENATINKPNVPAQPRAEK